MSKVRDKANGVYLPHMTGVDTQPKLERLDLRSTTKPVTENFQRDNLGPDTGHARASITDSAQGPVPGPSPVGPTLAPIPSE